MLINMRSLGFSMLEVMIALTVMVVSATTLMGLHANLQMARQSSIEVNRVNTLGRSIVEQIVAREASDIGDNTSVDLIWSRPRFKPGSGVPVAGTGGNNLPLSENAANADDDLFKTGLITEPTGIRNLQVYIEYYFGASSGASGGKLGIFDDAAFTASMLNGAGKIDIKSPDKFRSGMSGTSYRNTYRVNPNQAPAGQVQDNDNILVRVVLVWGSSQSMEFYTAKRKESF